MIGREEGLGGVVVSTARPLSPQSRPDSALSVGPNAATLTETWNKSPIVRQKDADPMFGQACFLNEGVDIGKKFAHADHNTRYRVQVNTRNNVRAEYAPACYRMGMKDDWHARLEQVIREDGRSLRKISEDAKCGPNFVQQLLKNRKDPRASQLNRLLDTLGPGADFYVVTGLRLSPDDLEFLQLVSALDQDSRKNVAALMGKLSEAQEASAAEHIE